MSQPLVVSYKVCGKWRVSLCAPAPEPFRCLFGTSRWRWLAARRAFRMWEASNR